MQVAALEAATLLLRRIPTLQSAAGAGAWGAGVAAGREFSSLPDFLAYR